MKPSTLLRVLIWGLRRNFATEPDVAVQEPVTAGRGELDSSLPL